jgi:hypothetical protein
MKLKRWKRLRYSLLSAAILLSIFAIVLGIWADRAHRQRAAVRAIRAVGANVLYNDQVRYDPLDASGTPLFDSDNIPGIDESWWRDFWIPVVVVDATSVRAFSDLELSKLIDLPRLRVLWAGSTNVTSRGVPYVRHCPELVDVDLARTAVDDSCVVHLAALKNLHSLRLTATKVSEEGLEELAGHPRLRYLAVGQTRLSREGFARLEWSLGKCKISYSPTSTVKKSALKTPGPPPGGGFAMENRPFDELSDPLPERQLTQDELAFYFEQSNILINERPLTTNPTEYELQDHPRNRVSAARELGKRLQHVCVIPVMAAILRDDSEDPMLKLHAAGALSSVAHPCSVEVLIETLPQGGYPGYAAELALASLTNVGVGRKKGEQIDQNPTPEDGLHRQKLWRAWWDKHGPSIKLRGNSHSHRHIPSEEEWQAAQEQQAG